MRTIVKITAAVLAALVFAAPSHAWAASDEVSGTLSVQNLDCGDYDFNIYSTSESCTTKKDYEIKNGTTASVGVVDTYKKINQDPYDGEVTLEKPCWYAVEAIGEMLGGYQYNAGDTVVCQMKTSSIVFKACRCN